MHREATHVSCVGPCLVAKLEARNFVSVQKGVNALVLATGDLLFSFYALWNGQVSYIS